MKPLAEFSPAKRGLGGVRAYCRPCCARKLRTPENRKKYAALKRQWMEANRTAYRAYNRLYAFARRQGVAVVDDGTATPEFLAALYASKVCSYCGKETPPNLRTADHVTPLVRGGAHSASNLVMACRRCNTRKNALTADEFKKRLESEEQE